MKVSAPFLLLVLVNITGVASMACGPTAQVGFEDARITMRVRTALLNDPELGTEAIEIVVRGGVVELTGRVTTADLMERAESVVRGVEGVRDVTLSLDVGPREEVGRDRPGRLPSIAGPREDGPSRIIAVGAGGTYSATPDAAVGNGTSYGPVIRLRPRNGWGPLIGFGWTKAPLRTSPTGQTPLASLAIRPIMGGVEYGVSRGRFASAFSLIGGYAFNSLTVDVTHSGPGRAIAVDNGVALRAGVSMWSTTSHPVWDSTSLAGIGLRGRP